MCEKMLGYGTVIVLVVLQFSATAFMTYSPELNHFWFKYTMYQFVLYRIVQVLEYTGLSFTSTMVNMKLLVPRVLFISRKMR